MDWGAIGVSLRLAALTTAILLVVAVPLAAWLSFSRRRWTVVVEAIVAAGDGDHPVGTLHVGDPDLLALDLEVPGVAGAVSSGAGADLDRVGAGVRLGESEADLDLAGREAGQDRLLLLLGAVPGQRGRPEAGVEHVDERAGGVSQAHSASHAMAVSSRPCPPPPYCSGTLRPSQPPSARSR